ncbi:MAG: dienelactone hydrolase family protein [Alphaproteobacteria bacterium]|nr:dienelactone hydrolase family protein [Alphaproteobacteria bacterium]
MKLNDYRIIPAEKPQQIVVLLHGVGADGKDLLDLGHRWQNLLPACVFVSPDAPHRYDMAPFGRQWFSLKDRTPQVMAADMITNRPIVNDYIDKLLAEFSLPSNKLALVGFSQGTMVSLDVGPRREDGLAGILGYSGSLLSHKSLHAEIRSRPPICLVSGLMDDIVSPDYSKKAQEMLQAEAIPCELHLQPNLGHSIDESGIRIGAAFLQRIFA